MYLLSQSNPLKCRTYREAENLRELTPRIEKALEAAGTDGEIIIVDDNSCDGTDEMCRQLALSCSLRLEIAHKQRGLATAVLRGMSVASGKVIVVMDADLSHPPEMIPELVRRLERADLVIGSRYVRGGSTAQGWGILRWLNSRCASLLARPLTSVKDPMAGFFAVRRSSVALARERLDPVGYKICLELLVKCGCRRVCEVPIRFEDRRSGTSKLTLGVQLAYLRHLKRLYEHRFGWVTQLVQFLTVGASGMVVDLLSFAMLLRLVQLPSARAVAIWLAMSWNFLRNRRVTFSSSARERSIVGQYLLFCLACLTGAVVNWSVTLALAGSVALFGNWPLVAAMGGILAGTAFNFWFCWKLVFAHSPGGTVRGRSGHEFDLGDR